MSCAKDSFDRFGDDLCELIISYMAIKDKTRCRCLSKRLSELSFRKQYELSVDYLDYKRQNRSQFCRFVEQLKTRFVKCPNTRSLRLSYTFEMSSDHSCWLMKTLTDHCPAISSFVCDSFVECDDCLEKFFAKFGQTLKTLKVLWARYEGLDFANIFNKCPNIEVFTIDNFVDDTFWNEISLPRLKKFYLFADDFAYKLLPLKWFLDNHQGLRVLEFAIVTDIQEDAEPELFDLQCVSLLESVSRLTQLKYWRIRFAIDMNDEMFEALELIGQQCRQLKKLAISFLDLESTDPLAKFVPLLGSFGQLTQLELNAILPDLRLYAVTSQTFGCLPELTHLEIDLGLQGKYDHFFEDISTHLKRLKVLRISKFGEFGPQDVEQVVKSSTLRLIYLEAPKNCEQRFALTKECDDRPKLEVFVSKY